MILAEILSDKVSTGRGLQINENEYRYAVLILLTGGVMLLAVIALALLAQSKR